MTDGPSAASWSNTSNPGARKRYHRDAKVCKKSGRAKNERARQEVAKREARTPDSTTDREILARHARHPAHETELRSDRPLHCGCIRRTVHIPLHRGPKIGQVRRAKLQSACHPASE